MLEMFIDGLFVSFSLMLIALGFALIFGVMRIVNLAHGELYMLAAYIVVILTAKAGWNYWLSFLPAIALVVLLGLVLERYVFRRYRGYLLPSLVVSIGIMMILQTSALLGADALGMGLGTQGMTGPLYGKIVNLLGVTLSWERLIWIIVGAVALLAILIFTLRTKTGKAVRACVQNPDAAAVLGINLNRMSVIVMSIGCALAAICGGLVAPVFGASHTMGLPFLVLALIAIVLGGMGSLLGCVIGVSIIGFAEAVAAHFWGPHGAIVVVYAILLVVLIVKPKGLFGYILHIH